jgi:hypothetical protein
MPHNPRDGAVDNFPADAPRSRAWSPAAHPHKRVRHVVSTVQAPKRTTAPTGNGRSRADSERAPRSFWFDPRFAIGIVLVIVSVLGVVAVVTAADSSVLVYAARTALSPGDRVKTSDLDARSVRLGSLGAQYLADGEIPRGGFVVTRPVSAGELVPTSAVGDVAGIAAASIVVSVDGELARSVGEGSVVDLWSAKEAENNVFRPPSVLVGHATVVRLIARDGVIADRSVQSVELLVPRTKIAAVLEAIANTDALSLVPTSIPAKG